MKKLGMIVILLLLPALFNNLYSQCETIAYQSDIIKKNNKVYFEGKPLTGCLLSDESGVPNKCDCTLKAHYKKGKLDGPKQEWYKSGKLKKTLHYKNGKIVGVEEEYYPNGNLKKKKNHATGTTELYYKNGNLKQKIAFKRINNNRCKFVTFYWDDGAPKKFEVYKKGKLVLSKKCTSDVDDCMAYYAAQACDDIPPVPKNIVYVDDYQTGTATEPEPLQEGEKKVLLKSNKSKIRVILYEQGLKKTDSLFDEYQQISRVQKYESGKLKTEEYFEDLLLQKRVEFYDNGNKKTEKFFEADELNPYKIIEYDVNGNLKTERNYESGALHGEQLTYKDGILNQVETYQYGSLIKRITYYPDGKTLKIVEEKFINDQPTLQTVYSEDGKDKAVYEFKNGKKIKQNYYIQGVLYKTVFYNQQEKPSEEWFYYDSNQYGSNKVKQKTIYKNGKKVENWEFSPEGYPVKSTQITKDGIRVELTYDELGNKLSEEAYQNDKLIRKGQYQNDEKQGEWKYYLSDGSGEILRTYNAGKLVSEKKLYYDRQIKNLLSHPERTKILKYTVKTYPQAPPKYYLLLYKFSNQREKDSEDVEFDIDERLLSKFNSFFGNNNNVTIVNQIDDELREKMIDGVVKFKNINYWFEPKNEKNKKFRFHLEFPLEYYEFDENNKSINKEVENYKIPDPITNIDDFGFGKKEKTFEEVYEAIDLKPFLYKICFPRKGTLLNVLKYKKESVVAVAVSFGENYVENKEIFYIWDETNPKYSAKLRVYKVENNQALLKVETGGRWLFQYLKKNKHPVLTERDTYL